MVSSKAGGASSSGAAGGSSTWSLKFAKTANSASVVIVPIFPWNAGMRFTWVGRSTPPRSWSFDDPVVVAGVDFDFADGCQFLGRVRDRGLRLLHRLQLDCPEGS